MSKISRDDVLKLARLARITLSDDEVEMYASEFSAILGYVDQLEEVEVDELKPTSQVTGLTNIMREDVVADYGYETDDLMQNLPNTLDDQIKVKRMIG